MNHSPRDAGAGRGIESRLTEQPDSTFSARRTQACRITDPRFRRTVENIYALGPRVVGELLIDIRAELSAGTCTVAAVSAKVVSYANIDPEHVRVLGLDQWPPALLHVVEL